MGDIAVVRIRLFVRRGALSLSPKWSSGIPATGTLARRAKQRPPPVSESAAALLESDNGATSRLSWRVTPTSPKLKAGMRRGERRKESAGLPEPQCRFWTGATVAQSLLDRRFRAMDSSCLRRAPTQVGASLVHRLPVGLGKAVISSPAAYALLIRRRKSGPDPHTPKEQKPPNTYPELLVRDVRLAPSSASCVRAALEGPGSVRNEDQQLVLRRMTGAS